MQKEKYFTCGTHYSVILKNKRKLKLSFVKFPLIQSSKTEVIPFALQFSGWGGIFGSLYLMGCAEGEK